MENQMTRLKQMDPNRYVDSQFIADYLGVKRKTIGNWASPAVGKFPKPDKENKHGRSYWLVSVFIAWLTEHNLLRDELEEKTRPKPGHVDDEPEI
jgi:hypothetical protein